MVLALCSLGGATNVLEKSTIALVPLWITVDHYGNDDLEAFNRFNVGCVVPATVVTAQTIAQLPNAFGLEMRVGINIVNMIL